MTEIYYRRWKTYFRGAILIMLALGYIIMVLFVKPSNYPHPVITRNYFLGAVMTIGLVMMLYVMWLGIGYLWDAFCNKPIVIITDQTLQVYDMSIRRYHIYNWKNVVKIERAWYKGGLLYDVYTTDDERMQLLDVGRWRRFILKLNAMTTGGAAVRIPANDLATDKTELFAELQNHLCK